jgi:hypothetical protein
MSNIPQASAGVSVSRPAQVQPNKPTALALSIGSIDLVTNRLVNLVARLGNTDTPDNAKTPEVCDNLSFLLNEGHMLIDDKLSTQGKYLDEIESILFG